MKNEFNEAMGKILKTKIRQPSEKERQVFNEYETTKKEMFLETVSLVEEKKLFKNDRIESMSNLLDRINSEIAKRDFSDVSTDKLIMLGVKIQESIKTEIQSTSIEIKRQDDLMDLDFRKTETIYLE